MIEYVLVCLTSCSLIQKLYAFDLQEGACFGRMTSSQRQVLVTRHQKRIGSMDIMSLNYQSLFSLNL